MGRRGPREKFPPMECAQGPRGSPWGAGGPLLGFLLFPLPGPLPDPRPPGPRSSSNGKESLCSCSERAPLPSPARLTPGPSAVQAAWGTPAPRGLWPGPDPQSPRHLLRQVRSLVWPFPSSQTSLRLPGSAAFGDLT